jgi:hypothetical protein
MNGNIIDNFWNLNIATTIADGEKEMILNETSINMG